MKVNISFMFPKEYRFAHFLYDLASVMMHGLQDLGHQTILTRQLVDPDYLNVLIGGYSLASPDSAAQLKAAKIPYVVYQTEMIRGDTINTQGEERYRLIYKPLLEGAVGVWDAYQSNVDELAKQSIEARVLDVGYHPALEIVRHKPDKDLDVFFFGSVGERRARILQTLQDQGLKVAAMFDDPALFRNDAIGRAKVNLSMRHNDEMTHMPIWRIKYLVNNRALVVGETATESELVDDLFIAAEPEDLIDKVKETVARDDREQLAEQFYERYRARPMKDRLEPLLDALDL